MTVEISEIASRMRAKREARAESRRESSRSISREVTEVADLHRTAGPLARVPGVRDGRVLAPYFEPSWATLASTGRQSTAWATQTARPTSAFDRAAPTASVACVGWQAASAQPLVGVPSPRPWHPTHSSLLRGARRHGTFSASPTLLTNLLV